MDSNAFYQEFIRQKRLIAEEIAKVTALNQKPAVLSQIAQLSDSCRQNRNILSAHDLQIYTHDLQELTMSLDSKTAGLAKPKFSFARKGPQNSAPIKNSKPARSMVDASVVSTNADLFTKDEADFVNIADETLEPDLKHKSVNFHTIRRTKLILKSMSLKYVKLSDLQDSFVFIKQVKGPLYITEAHNCVFIVNCHQFRMHSSSRCAIYISCSSKRPIIEACSDLKFAQFPSKLASEVESTRWEHVDDFNWIRREQSINWEPIQDRADVDITQPLSKLLTISQD